MAKKNKREPGELGPVAGELAEGTGEAIGKRVGRAFKGEDTPEGDVPDVDVPGGPDITDLL